MFISKKQWNLILSDIHALQDDVFLLQLTLKRYKKLLDVQDQVEAKKRHPASTKKTTTKKVEKNGK